MDSNLPAKPPTPEDQNSGKEPEQKAPTLLWVIVYLAYLYANRSQRTTDQEALRQMISTLRLLIIVVALVLVILLVVGVGAPELVPDILKNWSLRP